MSGLLWAALYSPVSQMPTTGSWHFTMMFYLLSILFLSLYTFWNLSMCVMNWMCLGLYSIFSKLRIYNSNFFLLSSLLFYSIRQYILAFPLSFPSFYSSRLPLTFLLAPKSILPHFLFRKEQVSQGYQQNTTQKVTTRLGRTAHIKIGQATQ